MTTLKLPLHKSLPILIGFPVGSFLLSLLLLNRELFSFLQVDFFVIFWLIITLWYSVQLLITHKILRSEGYNFAAIGYSFTLRQSILFCTAYFVVAFAIVLLVEVALQGATVTPERLSDFANLSPPTTVHRLIFVLMAFVGGITEELVYRGFAIRVVRAWGIHRILSVVIAAIPFVFQHGLKAFEQFGWFFIMGILFGLLFIWLRNLYWNIALHWLIVLLAILAILQVMA